MADQNSTSSQPDFAEAARLSQQAGIADESAAYETAVEKDAPPSLDEGDPKTTNDGSGTSETD